jgi:hypothetical protein
MKISVPSGNAFFNISRVVRHRIDADVLDHDRSGTPLDNAEEDVVRVGPLKRDVEPETVAIKRQGCGDILDDEERRDAGISSLVKWFHGALRTDRRQKRADLAQHFGLSRNEQIVTNRTQVHYARARNLTYQLVSPTAKDDTAPRSKRIDRLPLLGVFRLVM